MHADDLLGRDVTEHRDFLLGGFCQRLRHDQPARDLSQPMRVSPTNSSDQVKTGKGRPGQVGGLVRARRAPLSA
jgi:hypothetical protein